MDDPELTKEESELYYKIVKSGKMDDMFDFAYAIGRARSEEENLKRFQKDYPNDKENR